jgi:hypothetical protein
MHGTYIREPDGATLLLHSPHTYGDAASALRSRPEDFRPVRLDALPPKLRREVEWLSPGEYLQTDGLVVEVGGGS